MTLRTSPKGIALINSFESLRLKAYPDPKTGGAPWTIGRGYTGTEVHAGMTCTEAQADAWQQSCLTDIERRVNAAVHVPLTQGQFDALVSIVYNVGPGSADRDGILRLRDGQSSTLLRLLNAGDYAGCAAQFPKWCSPGSSVTSGLLRRRNAERALFEEV